VHDDCYAAFMCGLDYTYVREHGTYRQLLFQIGKRAQARGMRLVRLGMDADVEKNRYGTRVEQSLAYGQVRDTYNASVLRDIVEQVAMRQAVKAA